MKCIRRILACLLLLSLMLPMAGCGSWLWLQEDELYQQAVHDFFDALDKGDADAMLALFSENVRRSDPNLRQQVEKLISIYPRSTTTIKDDGARASIRESDEGKHKSEVSNTFPVVCNDVYYWVDIQLIYEDDFEPDNVGLNQVLFFTADEFCIIWHDEDLTYPTECGLLVFAEQELDAEVRCINSYPYEFMPIERAHNLEQMEAFLHANTELQAFVNTFGEANAKDDWMYFYYEVEENGKRVYLELFAEEGEIQSAVIVDDFAYIRTIIEYESD